MLIGLLWGAMDVVLRLLSSELFSASGGNRTSGRTSPLSWSHLRRPAGSSTAASRLRTHSQRASRWKFRSQLQKFGGRYAEQISQQFGESKLIST